MKLNLTSITLLTLALTGFAATSWGSGSSLTQAFDQYGVLPASQIRNFPPRFRVVLTPPDMLDASSGYNASCQVLFRNQNQGVRGVKGKLVVDQLILSPTGFDYFESIISKKVKTNGRGVDDFKLKLPTVEDNEMHLIKFTFVRRTKMKVADTASLNCNVLHRG